MEMTSDATKNHASNDSKVRVVPNGSTEHIAAAQSRDTAGTEAASQDSDSITGWRLTIIATAIPRITDQFHSLDQVGWYASALFLAVAATQSFWGKAFKFFPLKIVYLVAIFIFELGSLLCGVAPNSSTLIAGRAITGFGVAGYLAGSYIIIGVCAPEKHRPALTALMGSAYSIASVVGPFYINLPCGAVAGAFVFLFLRIPSAAKPAQATWKEKLRQMDITGVILVTAAVVCYLFALQWGGVSKDWGSADVVGTLVGFTSLLTLFFVHEWWEGERSLLLPSVMKNRTILSGCIFSFFIAGHFYILLYYLPIYFQAVRGASATASVFQSLGGAIIVSAGQSIFQNELIDALPYTSPNLDPKAVLAVGATDIKNVFPASELPGIYDAYMKGIRLAFACSIPMSGVAALVAISQPWFKLPKEQKKE
ncbi:MAG: hypothetical protein OHK93_005163 [Ramalina farinacea]|uniref:Major facilitator superfamily (MFS) profile domain-containing protein n=1 Tax=Ramalina farinacea TaxID=258253 RepID=A0AA43QVL9_9LECA|nr:hypothetical protein [Ramalina farinacea]